MEEEEGLTPNFKGIDARVPWLCVVYSLDQGEFYVWNNPNTSQCEMFLSPFFFWITWLFSQSPPISFMDPQWLDKLRLLMYNAAAYTPTYTKTKLAPFNVDTNVIQQSVTSAFPGSPWIFIYDNCVDGFSVTGSSPENGDNDSCALICFLRMFLSKIGRLPPFITEEGFEAEMYFTEGEEKMKKAIVEWLRDGVLFLEEDDNGLLRMAVDEAQGEDELGEDELGEDQQVVEDQEVVDQENEDSKGKEDL